MVSCIPRCIAATMAIMVTNACFSVTAVAGPIVARMVAFSPREVCRAVILGTSENVMSVRFVASSVD